MKRMLSVVVVIAISSALVLANAFADEPEVVTLPGHVLVGNPASYFAGAGLTENLGNCGNEVEGELTQGVDGQWFDISAYQGWYADLIAGSSALGEGSDAADFDLYFWDSTCAFIDDYTMAQAGDDFGAIPFGANYGVVDLFFGADADFTLTLTNPCTLPEEEQPEWCEEEAT